MMTHKGYIGQVEFDDEADLFHGEVINTRDVITFQGTTVRQLRKSFRDSVDFYLNFCRKRGEEPEKPYSGQFLVRVSPELHRNVSRAASLAGMSLNAWVSNTLECAVREADTLARAHSSASKQTPRGEQSAEFLRHRETILGDNLTTDPSSTEECPMTPIEKDLDDLIRKGIVRLRLADQHGREHYALNCGEVIWHNMHDDDEGYDQLNTLAAR